MNSILWTNGREGWRSSKLNGELVCCTRLRICTPRYPFNLGHQSLSVFHDVSVLFSRREYPFFEYEHFSFFFCKNFPVRSPYSSLVTSTMMSTLLWLRYRVRSVLLRLSPDTSLLLYFCKCRVSVPCYADLCDPYLLTGSNSVVPQCTVGLVLDDTVIGGSVITVYPD